MRKICKAHTAIIVFLLIAGFTLLDIVLISIHKKAVGIVGIAMLYLIPAWYFCVSYAETTGLLNDVHGDSMQGVGVQEQPGIKQTDA